MASIPDNNTAATPYVIKIAPGTYTETTNVAMKNYVDVEGSGQDITTIKCACSSNGAPDASSAVISAGAITAEIRHLTINNTGGSNEFSVGVYTDGVADGSFSMLHVTATANGTVYSYGVYNTGSSPTMNNVTATSTSTDTNYGVYNKSSSPTMNNVTATATGTGGINNYGVNNSSSSPTMNNVTATATGGTGLNYAVYNDSSSSPTIRNSSITGTTNSIFNRGGSTAKVADTALGGGVDGGGFTCVLYSSYTTEFVGLNDECAEI